MSLVEGNAAGFRNKTELAKFVRSHDGASIADLIKAISIKLVLAMLANNEAHHHRLDAGRMLLELRTRVEADGGDWWKWQEGQFDRSRKDMEKLLRMASADEPEVAAQTERVEAQLRMKRVRANGANVRSMPQTVSDPAKIVGAFHHELTNILDDYCARLEAFLEANPDLDDDCLGSLINVLEVNSMRLQQLAQQIDGRDGGSEG